MKVLFETMMKAALAGVAAFALFSCNRAMLEPEMPEPEEIPGQAGDDTLVGNDGDVREVHFRALQGDRTKAQFGTPENGAWPTLWTDNDTQLKLSLNYGSAQTAGVTPSEDYQSATIVATINFSDVSGPYTYYAVSPASAAMALSPSREAWKVSIPCEQTPTAGSADEGAIILASASQSYATAGEAEVVDLYFNHLTAYGCLSLSNLDLGGATVQAVELTITTPFVGDWFWNCQEEQGAHTLTDFGASSTLTISTSSLSDIWFGCAPVDVSGEVLVVSVYTDAGVYTQEKIFPDYCQFTAGQAAVFTVDMDGASFTAATGSGSGSGNFELVTDASALAAGNEVIITNTGRNKALGSNAGSYRNAVDITVSNDAISSTGTASVLTLIEGSSNNTWAFQDSNSYIATSSNKNSLGVSSNIGATSSWSISISNGVATIVAQSGSYNYLQYNSSSPRFSGYAGTQQNVVLFRRSSSASADPLLSESEYGCYLGTGLEWVFSAGTDQVTRSYDSYGVQTYTLINPTTVDELEVVGYKRSFVKGDDVNVTVNWRSGTSTKLNSAQYAMKLIKEQGPKVWLSDGNGHGIILKK